jgi:hypothetical protein
MGFEPMTYSLGGFTERQLTIKSIKDFKEWLYAKYSKKHAQNVLNYATKFQHMLFNPRKASALLTFTPSKKHLIMFALAALSKWAGCYRQFKILKEDLGLKWSTDNGSEVFRRLLDESKKIENIDSWFNQIRELGWDYYFPTVFMVLTGLRIFSQIRYTNYLEHIYFETSSKTDNWIILR